MVLKLKLFHTKKNHKMRMTLKHLFVILLTVGSISNTIAQNESNENASSQKTIDSLQVRIFNLNNLIEDRSYTRIPNKDFENIIDNKIQSTLRETIKWWLFVIAAVISLGGLWIHKYAKSYLQNIVERNVNQLRKENEETITRISFKYFSSAIDSLLDFKMEIITKKKHKVEEAVVDDLQSYLNEESTVITKQKKADIIDTIMTCYYKNDYTDKIKKMIDLIKKYEEKLTLAPTTYANAAIAFLDRYEMYGTKDYLTSAISNCDKSITALPDYGLAFAVKIELYLMAISKAFDDTEKKHFENELLKVFKDIDNNSSTYLCKEIIDRFEIDRNSFIKPYLDQLYAQYPEKMGQIEKRIPPVSENKELPHSV